MSLSDSRTGRAGPDPDMIPAWVDGVLTPFDKLRAHQLGLRHKAVSVFVLSGDEVLLQRRALGKYHTPGLWANACCTHPLWDEAPRDCAIRRLAQELGLEGQGPEFRKQLEYRADVGGGLIEHELVDVFTVETARDLPLAPDPAEVMETRWMTRDALRDDLVSHPDRYTPWLRIYMQEHGVAIFA